MPNSRSYTINAIGHTLSLARAKATYYARLSPNLSTNAFSSSASAINCATEPSPGLTGSTSFKLFSWTALRTTSAHVVPSFFSVSVISSLMRRHVPTPSNPKLV